MSALERFISYAKVNTQSKEGSDSFPSTKNQRGFLSELALELRKMGVEDVRQDMTYGYVYATIPSNCKDKVVPSVGFIAHVDTSDAMSGEGVQPRVIENYDGNDICLNKEKNIMTLVKDFPELKKYKGKTLVVTDGTTLLGADDKAGVTEIMEMVKFFMEHPRKKHGNICVAFTADEEIGKGVEFFRIADFGAHYAYTLDGGEIGEISYENFNAAGAKLTINGRSVHPGEAKGKMVNAILVVQEFQNLLPQKERPEYTENREGFYHLLELKGTVEAAEAEYIIRDHDFEKFEMRKKTMEEVAKKINAAYGEGTAKLKIEDSYYNMEGKVLSHPCVLEKAKKAMKALKIKPLETPIRGGTDGAKLSYLGLPCPNLGIGAGAFHGKHEYLCVEDMEKNIELIIQIVQEFAKD